MPGHEAHHTPTGAPPIVGTPYPGFAPPRLSREALNADRRECRKTDVPHAPQHFLYFFPLPHGHGSLRPTFGALRCGGSRPST
ncbi:hypothetical protein JCM17961_29930 [Endothiovibrio diazotrophicus]